MNREQLYENVWKEEYFGETRTLDNHIKRLRQKLGYEDVIQTVFRKASAGAKTDLVHHVTTQLPYAMTVARIRQNKG